MAKSTSFEAVLLIDMKKYRIRIRKQTLHQLGDPSYIQLLINPESMDVAIKSVDHVSSRDQTHTVSKKTMLPDNSIEIYSQAFIKKLKEVTPDLKDGFSYHLSGEVIPSDDLAVFSLKTLQQIN